MAETGKEAAASPARPEDTDGSGTIAAAPVSTLSQPYRDAPQLAPEPDSRPRIQPTEPGELVEQLQETPAVDGPPATPTPAEQEAAPPPESQAPDAPPRLTPAPDAPPPLVATESANARDAPPKQIESVGQGPPRELSDAAGQPQHTVEAASLLDSPATLPTPTPAEQEAVPPPASQAPPPLVATESANARDATPKQIGSVGQGPPQELSEAAGQPQRTLEAAGRPDSPATRPPPPEPPSQEKAVPASEDGKQLPLSAPPPPRQQEQDGGAAGEAPSVPKEEKDSAPVKGSAVKTRARRLWDLVRNAVLRPRFNFNLSQNKTAAPPGDRSAPPPEDKGSETKPPERDGNKKPASQKEEKKPYGKDGAGGVPADPAKKGEDEAQQAPVEAPSGKPQRPWRRRPGEPDSAPPLVKRLQNKIKLLMSILSWYKDNKRRSKPKDEPPGATEDDKDGKTKQTTASEEEKEEKKDGGETKAELTQSQQEPPLPKWAKEMLEDILEEAFTKLLWTEYKQQLDSVVQKKCLLTFSIFDLAAEVKKQAMIYWWISQFNLPYGLSSKNNSVPALPEQRKPWRLLRFTKAPAAVKDSPAQTGHDKLGAEEILSRLSDLGFLEPFKNYCCGVIHGCKVNPLAHWMVKRLAKDGRFADLDADGEPTQLQTTSSILCLTKDNRTNLHHMRIKELSQSASSPQASVKSPEEQTKAGNEPSQAPTEVAEVDAQDEASMVKIKSTVQRISSQTKKVEQIKDLPPIKPKGKQAIINIDAHVYALSMSLFENLSDCLVLQLGRWCHHDNKTYMEVDGLDSESLCAMSTLKNVKYLSLRGLSRLTKLPCWIQKLKSLKVLDMRGCQNLATVATKDISQLNNLTHLDLTECYMLEHIGQGIASLPNLQVFKGFVFGSRSNRDRQCRLEDLKKLKRLQKLTISITTDAHIKKDEMKQLSNLTKLRSLTITWSEIPSILMDDPTKEAKQNELLTKWTNFELPQDLEKLDLRCYPKTELHLNNPKNIKKLYLRGGEVVTFSIAKKNYVTTLRLRYLNKINMTWGQILPLLEHIEYVEIRAKDERSLKGKDLDDNDMKDLKKEIEEEKKHHKILEKMKIPKFILDENGVWTKDKEEEKRRGNEGVKIENKDQGAIEESKDTASFQDADKVLDKNRKSETDIGDTSDTQEGKEDQVHSQGRTNV